MVAEIPNWVFLVGVLVVLFVLSQDSSDNPGVYNRGVLQQTSPEKLNQYVGKEWERRGYDTQNDPDAEYVDVIAESEEEKIAISVRRRQEDNRVSRNAVKRFSRSAESVGADRSIMASSSYFTKPAREEAKQEGITLLDGDELADIFTDHDGIPG
jgi:restriction endonuclease Mrr